MPMSYVPVELRIRHCRETDVIVLESDWQPCLLLLDSPRHSQSCWRLGFAFAVARDSDPAYGDCDGSLDHPDADLCTLTLDGGQGHDHHLHGFSQYSAMAQASDNLRYIFEELMGLGIADRLVTDEFEGLDNQYLCQTTATPRKRISLGAFIVPGLALYSYYLTT